MKYLSVCSGIEAASVAWHPLGWKPLAFSEIEKFPRSVLQHHYPDVPLHGDFTVLRDQDWIVDADILVGGTPCQAFSVAGLRNSLADERGNLSLEFVRLADAIDNLRHTDGRAGAIIVWENVPGVLSVKDNAFGCFLAGLAGDVAPYDPPRGKWTNAGVVIGPSRTVAWRILDAQYFGVAQRRRRVFVVASSRDGFDPAAVLLEFEGVRRDSAPSRKSGQEVAGTIAARFGISRNNHEECVVNGSHWDSDEYPHPTLNQSAKGSGGVGASNQELFSQRGAYLAPYAEITGPLTAGMSKGLRGTEGIESNWAVIHGTQDPCVSEIAFAQGRNNGGENVLVQPIAIHPHCIGRSPDAGPQGKEYILDGSAYTMDSRGVAQAVATPVSDVAPTIGSSGPPYSRTGNSRVEADALATIGMSVRRLTPRECERLQGFPDDYTLISDKTADGPRYKALGNSMAVPVMHFIGRRIAGAFK